MSRQLRNWLFTCYDLTNFKVPEGDDILRFCIYQEEICPTSARKHLQGYAEFITPMRLKRVQDFFGVPNMHCEGRRGTQDEAIAYCSKEDTRVPGTVPIEFGVRPNSGKRSDIIDLVASVRAGDSNEQLLDQYPASFFRYSKNVDRIRMITRPTEHEHEVFVYIGKPGTGKTRAAYQYALDNKLSCWATPFKGDKSTWFDGFDMHPLAIIDDFAGEMPLTQLLRLLDRYPIQVPIKGGYTWWLPKVTIITTNAHPSRWYDYTTRTDSALALRRRFTAIIDFDNDQTPIAPQTFWFILE